jgi:hypothetical protein
MADVVEPVLEDVLGDQRRRQLLLLKQVVVHPDHEHLFVVGAVEDADLAALRQTGDAAPEKIMIELLVGRLLEGVHLAALGVHAGHHVLDRAVLARGIHGLEDEEHGPAILRVEHVL